MPVPKSALVLDHCILYTVYQYYAIDIGNQATLLTLRWFCGWHGSAKSRGVRSRAADPGLCIRWRLALVNNVGKIDVWSNGRSLPPVNTTKYWWLSPASAKLYAALYFAGEMSGPLVHLYVYSLFSEARIIPVRNKLLPRVSAVWVAQNIRRSYLT